LILTLHLWVNLMLSWSCLQNCERHSYSRRWFQGWGVVWDAIDFWAHCCWQHISKLGWDVGWATYSCTIRQQPLGVLENSIAKRNSCFFFLT
jgi:hypothetical protein